MTGDWGAAVAAGLVASLGLWWFHFMLKGLKSLPRATRYGVYAGVWLAYFILVMMLASRAQPS
ncbi:MAG: hypothetical protein AB7P23_03195 [Amphiplicatus sp.]